MTQAPSTPKLKILLADDNDANRLIARTILERAGHNVTTAQNGSHALSLAKLASFDLIILDIMMPVMDGMRALRQLRRDKSSNSDVPIFALTAYCSAEDKQRYFLAGFDSVLSKPLRTGDLENAYIRHKDKRVSPLLDTVDVRTSANVPLLDYEMIEQLSEAGSAERLSDIQKRFWDSVQIKCEIIKDSLPEALRGDGHFLSQFRRAVHAVKGAGGAIGLARVSHIGRELQNAPPEDIAPLMIAFADALSQSRPELTAALNGDIDLVRSRELNTSVQMSG